MGLENVSIQKFVSTIVVALLLAAIIGGLKSWNDLSRVDERLLSIETWKNSSFFTGKRYTLSDGVAEAAIRSIADTKNSDNIQRIEKALALCQRRLNTGESREHAEIKALAEKIEWLEDLIKENVNDK